MNVGDFRPRLVDRARRAGLALPPSALDALEAYYSLLTRWNRRINLTSLPLEPLTDSSLERLLIEPLMAAAYVEDLPSTWFDLGSGGGSPAIPLKIVRPRVRLTLVESRSRKAAFLREVARSLQLPEVVVIADRFENLLTENDQTADLITARAVRLDTEMLSVVSGLLRPSGELLFFGTDATAPPVSTLTLRKTVALHADGASKLFVFRKSDHS